MVLGTLFGGSGEASASGNSPAQAFGLSLTDSASAQDESSEDAKDSTTEEATGEATDSLTEAPAEDVTDGATDVPTVGALDGASDEASGTATPSGTQTVNASPTEATGDATNTATDSASDSPTDGASDSPSGPESPSPTVSGTGPCSKQSIEVKVAPGAKTLASGTGTSLTMTVGNSGDVACTRNVGSGANEITILATSGKVVYSTDHCNPSTAAKTSELAPGDPKAVTVTWDGRTSSQGCGGGAGLPAGTYTVVARNGDVTSDPVTITVK
jgi:hypothetical protein